MSEYDFEIKHIRGKENIVDDALGRKQHQLHLVLISNYEYQFKILLKEASVNDEQYGKWMEKCTQQNLETNENLY